ncbi:MAG: helix-turn-helix domain-containing protein [bacterium]|nr:helix-turn-helix domain-containing protein [bacterium]
MSKMIGKKLRKLRKRKVMSQQELAEKVNITRSTISNYELGKRTPHLKDLQKFCKIFNVGLDYFEVKPKDEAENLLHRAKEVFESNDVSPQVKEQLYIDFMHLYLDMKGEKKNEH